MLKVKFTTLWKLAVLLLLAIIAFYSYRIDADLSGTYYAPGGGCGYYNNPTPALKPLICVQPATNKAQ